jgi:hypothetical protein
MATIHGYPNAMPKESNKWFPKFPENNVVTIEDHLYIIRRDMDNASIKHEDVSMRLLASSLTKETLVWFRGLQENHFMSYKYFSKIFKSI